VRIRKKVKVKVKEIRKQDKIERKRNSNFSMKGRLKSMRVQR